MLLSSTLVGGALKAAVVLVIDWSNPSFCLFFESDSHTVEELAMTFSAISLLSENVQNTQNYREMFDGDIGLLTTSHFRFLDNWDYAICHRLLFVLHEQRRCSYLAQRLHAFVKHFAIGPFMSNGVP